ncbi:hypothetical protein RHMOL_Rhmol06G0026000 [Rhododendron molle]|uniref:Uncharacterized protein n=1 Tax=Rhododendron molle TaxID=49168 RepID=A0ACC0N871_RHOML|nr:hypothetical protein RHMOL_Rhmol06G0026000 [Rhododendron molle]
MGRKKPTARDEEIQDGGGKLRKKAVVVDDDEYSIGTELSEEQQVQDEKIASVGGKKKGKKGASKNSQQKDEDVEKEDEVDDDVPVVQFVGKKKSKSKKSGSSTSFSSSSFGLLEEVDDDDDKSGVTLDNDDDVGSDDDEPVVSFSGKKKSTKSGKGNSNRVRASAFGAIADDDDDEGGEAIDNSTEKQSDNDDDDVVISFSGKKKHSKSNKKSSASMSGGSGIDELDHGEETKDEAKEEEEEDDAVAAISFSGKKKSSSSSKKSSKIYSDALIDEETEEGTSFTTDDSANLDEYTSEVMFSGKKKSSKKKSNSVFSALESRLGDESNVDLEEPSVVVSGGKQADGSKLNKQVIEDVVETSKNKKKKKKSGRTAQEEDDLDKLLAELGEGPTMAKPAPAPPPPQENKVQTQLESVGLEDASLEKEVEEEGGVESAAAKKKKKKKEKEKEKKAAAAAAAATTPAEELRQEKQEDAKNETKGKATDKKVPKHVREMQERLARLKELEEKKKREEEEKLRKEEEERRRQEELERIAEEKKRLRKEKEKEKLQKKKLEGKLLTGKQKEEARRLEAMRNQILANAGGLPVATGDAAGAPTKRPKYQTKKKTHNSQANGMASEKASESTEAMEDQQESVAEVESLELEGVEEVETMIVEEKAEVVTDVVDENVIEEDDEDEWDAKSWDEADLKLPGTSAFADEEDESVPEHVGKKEASTSKAAVVAPKVTTTLPVKSLDGESKKSRPEADSVDTNKAKEPKRKKEPHTPDAQPNQSEADLRSPICCIMGHVDTGKTKLLDCIRGTNVQEGEAGGITQQIGATYFPAVNIRERTKELKADAKLKVPGLLVIDTPGHESFTNLRSRGSGLCDIAILVVDIMHGLEPQTIESLNLLKMRNTEFIVALNKVDRLYGWKASRNAPIVKTMKQQSKDVLLEFNTRVTQVITQFKEQGLNTELYYKNKEMGETFSIVPTSAISGEGIPDLLLLLVQWTQKTMVEKLTFSNEVQGPIATTIRALLTPHPMKELRVKGTYLHHKEIKAAQGIKITAQGLEHAIAGTGLYVVGPNDDLEDVKESAMEDMKSVLSRIDKSGEGVCVQASTLGSLEALLEFLKSPAVNIPVSGISIGPVHKKDVMKASVMLEKKKEFATILAFDVKVTPEARELADEAGVKIFIADIIYHLFDQFKAYIDNLKEEKKKEAAEEAVFPCVLRIMPNCVFNKKDPIVLGVDVVEGIAKVGTPICIPQREFIDIGRIASIENNHKPVDYAKKGQKAAIKIVGSNSEEQQKMFGRHFEMEDELVSHISRKSIDVLKTNYRVSGIQLCVIRNNQKTSAGVFQPPNCKDNRTYKQGGWVHMDELAPMSSNQGRDASIAQ